MEQKENTKLLLHVATFKL